MGHVVLALWACTIPSCQYTYCFNYISLSVYVVPLRPLDANCVMLLAAKKVKEDPGDKEVKKEPVSSHERKWL